MAQQVQRRTAVQNFVGRTTEEVLALRDIALQLRQQNQYLSNISATLQRIEIKKGR